MKSFKYCSSPAAVLLRDNIDTDMIVRIERLTTLKRGQFSPWVFEVLRYRADGGEDESFVLNRAPFRAARILISGANFGCGSSREMAVWALDDFGIRCVIAQSYGDIFYNNCLQNGLLPIALTAEEIAVLAGPAQAGRPLHVDLRMGTIRVDNGPEIAFDFPELQRLAFMEGKDDIDQSMAFSEDIEAFRRRDRNARPWVYTAQGQ